MLFKPSLGYRRMAVNGNNIVDAIVFGNFDEGLYGPWAI
jgi:hypothetical protein